VSWWWWLTWQAAGTVVVVVVVVDVASGWRRGGRRRRLRGMRLASSWSSWSFSWRAAGDVVVVMAVACGVALPTSLSEGRGTRARCCEARVGCGGGGEEESAGNKKCDVCDMLTAPNNSIIINIDYSPASGVHLESIQK
jgi:hypothetical protein